MSRALRLWVDCVFAVRWFDCALAVCWVVWLSCDSPVCLKQGLQPQTLGTANPRHSLLCVHLYATAALLGPRRCISSVDWKPAALAQLVNSCSSSQQAQHSRPRSRVSTQLQSTRSACKQEGQPTLVTAHEHRLCLQQQTSCRAIFTNTHTSSEHAAQHTLRHAGLVRHTALALALLTYGHPSAHTHLKSVVRCTLSLKLHEHVKRHEQAPHIAAPAVVDDYIQRYKRTSSWQRIKRLQQTRHQKADRGTFCTSTLHLPPWHVNHSTAVLHCGPTSACMSTYQAGLRGAVLEAPPCHGPLKIDHQTLYVHEPSHTNKHLPFAPAAASSLAPNHAGSCPLL